MDLQDALSQIGEIRRQVALTEVYRGYRSVPVAFSGLLAMGAAVLQAWWLPEALTQPGAYLTLWLMVAVLSLLAAGAEMAYRYFQRTSALNQAMTRLALSQFFPSIVAGGLVTVVLYRWAPENLWMLPGLWAVVFSLGIFASHRLLPGAVGFVGLYYLATGLGCLAMAQGDASLSPWAMAIPFGGGQLLAATILYWTLERNDAGTH